MTALVLRFLYIGLFAVGGGLSAISLIQEEVVEHLGWLTAETLVDILAIAEMTPGPIAVNAASFVGMNLHGISGAIAATVACVLPGCVISCLIYRANSSLQRNLRWRCALKILRAAVVGVMVSGGLVILKNTLCFEAGGLDGIAVICLAGGLVFYRRWRGSPILFMLVMGTICGIFRLILLKFGVNLSILST